MTGILWQDLRFAARLLGRRPGFTAVALITLALGIGANTAIFSVLNGVVLQPPPYPQPERVVRVYSTYQNRFDGGILSPGMYFDWKEVEGVFHSFSVIQNTSLIFTGGKEPESVPGTKVAPEFFAVLGVPPVLGRSFTAGEDTPGRDRVIILSHGLWQRRFGGDKNILGGTVTLEGETYTVVGIMPAGFLSSGWPQFWIPFAETAQLRNQRECYYLSAVGRLKEGVTLEQASQALTNRLQQLQDEFPMYKNRGGRVVPIHEDQIRFVKTNLWMLLAAVGFVLLIACANVANLLLARAAAREKEFALRSAIGAGRPRLLRQLLTESVLLAGAGAALGSLVAWGGVRVFTASSPLFFPGDEKTSLDLTVFGYTLGITLMTGTLFGLAPALQSGRVNLVEALKEGGRTAGGFGAVRHNWLRHGLVVAETALALVLLVGAGLLVRSFVTLMSVEIGFQPENLLMAEIALPSYKYSEGHQQERFFSAVLERLRVQPQVENAAAVSALPFSGSLHMDLFSLPQLKDEEGNPVTGFGSYASVTPEYFQTLGIPLLKGRAFTPQEAGSAPAVAVVSESFAKKYFQGEEAVGKILKRDEIELTIVGVVGDVRQMGLNQEPDPTCYVQFARFPDPTMMLVVRTTGLTEALAEVIRTTVRTLDPDQPVQRLEPVERLISESAATDRFYMLLFLVFAGMAATLAAVGIYGVMAYIVNLRKHEFGVRMALGAQRSDVLRLVLRQGLVLASIGAALGLAGAFALTRYLESLLFGIETTDALTFTSISVLLLATSLLACWVPARRAAHLHPMEALRYE